MQGEDVSADGVFINDNCVTLLSPRVLCTEKEVHMCIYCRCAQLPVLCVMEASSTISAGSLAVP